MGKVKTKYGREFPESVSGLDIELVAFRKGLTKESGGLGKYQHYKNIVEALWPWKEKERKGFCWHPWAEDMGRALCENNYVGFAGNASSGKSDALAIWSIVNWLAMPLHTLVLVTSTNVRDAKKRIWGAVQRYYYSLPQNALPGKITDSPTPAINTVSPDGKRYDQAGIFLIPSDKTKSNEVSGKMQGMKNDRVFLVADELSELSTVLIGSVKENLVNNPNFHMSAASNPASYLDPFGKFSEPKHGWDSISVNDTEWETHEGACLHFDSLKNPNYLEGRNLWPIQGYEKVERALQLFEDKKMGVLEWWRMYRGFWSPIGFEDSIYNEAEILRFKGAEKAVWYGGFKTVGGCDPSFTSGGDRCIIQFINYGLNTDKVNIIEFVEIVPIIEDMDDKETPRTFQIVRKIIEECKKRGVQPADLAVDSTGAGSPFCDALEKEWGGRVYRVTFGGKASEKPMSKLNTEESQTRYANKVTEIWFAGVEFLRAGQVRGMSADLIREATARKYETIKGVGMKLQVEPKKDMKARVGFSPDIADAAFIGVLLCRDKLKIQPVGSQKVRNPSNWKKIFKKIHSIYELPTLKG